MASTIEYHTEHHQCPECGTENEIEVFTEYDTQDVDFYIDVAGFQLCINKDCGHQFEALDLIDD